MPLKVRASDVATEVDSVASTCQPEAEPVDKANAVRVWQDIVARSGIDDKVIAAEVGMDPTLYSKVAAGKQGCLLALVYKLPRQFRAMRREFLSRLTELEHADPIDLVAEQLAMTAIRFLRMRATTLPARAKVYAKASIQTADRRHRESA